MNMRILLIVLLAAFTLPALADGYVKDGKTSKTSILEGTIKDKDSGEYLAGVMVKIEGTDKMAYTDFDGKFSIEGIAPGEYKVVTDYISYEKKCIQANVSEHPEGETVEIKIEKLKPLQ